MTPQKIISFCFLLFIYGLSPLILFAQEDSSSLTNQHDTTNNKPLIDHLKNKNGFISKVMRPFMQDTAQDNDQNIRRNDVQFQKYQGAVIRNIIISELPFGISISDSERRVVTFLTKLANGMHRISRPSVIRNNLFFNSLDTVQPFVMADNIRFLRQLPFIQDASIRLEPVPGSSDSVDVIVVTKDLFSIGGSIGSLDFQRSEVEAREDNFAGLGNALMFQGLYDSKRRNNFGIGAGYIQRNIGGSFINAELGYQSFFTAIDGPKEENYYYGNLLRPLASRYMRWTYEVRGSYHTTRNMYHADSIYFENNRYRYYNLDSWVGYNLNPKDFTIQKEDRKLRKLIGLRIFKRDFQEVPLKYSSDYYWKFASLTGVLGSITLYRQNFYKTQYIYGFGRNEDIPEGINLTVTSGVTRKQGVVRPFLGFNYERSHFNEKNNYISYKIRAEGNLRKTSLEDINLLAGIFYVRHLRNLGTRWKQRFFLNLDVAQQVNTVLNEQLLLNSQYGLPEYGNRLIGGTLRATAKVESVFFSPWSVAAFSFAPFVFFHTSIFSPYLSNAHLYSSIGGGLRIRNESLIFGTFEIKGFYFPSKNYYKESFRLDIATDLRFKYNPQLINKPDFIQIN